MPVQCTCRTCGAVFAQRPSQVARGDGKYCSNACRPKRVERVCEACGARFTVAPSEPGRGHGRFCSRACQYRKSDRVCLACGRAFSTSPSIVARGQGLYCSRVCRMTRVTRACATCGSSFMTTPSQIAKGRGKYCSRSCTSRSHGEAGSGRVTPEYRAWFNMKTRCLNPRTWNFERYGGRGITVCDRWRDSYEAFLADVGRRPSPAHSIDRIDVNGHYEPGNVRWAIPTEQARNRRSARLLTFDGVTRSVSEWGRALGFKQSVLLNRIHRGWSVERMLTTPVPSDD